MEGISHEACSLAGTWSLGKLIAFYDDNGISIDGHVEGWFTDDTPSASKPTAGMWCADVDGHDAGRASKPPSKAAQAETDKPTLICCKTVHRSRLPQQSRHATTATARPWAPTKSPPRAPHWAGTTRRFEIPSDVYAAWDAEEGRCQAKPSGTHPFAAYASRIPRSWPPNSPAA